MKFMHNTGGRSRFLAIIGVAIFMVGFVGTSARANVWQFQDSFDGPFPYTWWVVGSAGGGVRAPSTPRTGTYTMYMFANTGGWVSVRQTVNLTPFLPGRTLNTVAAIYARPASGTNAKVSVEVIDPSTWTYMTAVKTVTLQNSFTWQLVVTDLFVPNRKDIVVRVSVGSDAGLVGVDLDDLTVQAQYF